MYPPLPGFNAKNKILGQHKKQLFPDFWFLVTYCLVAQLVKNPPARWETWV